MTSRRRASPPWGRRVLLCAAALVGSLGVATAKGPPRLLLVDVGGPDLARKIAAEAADVGFDVIRTDPQPPVEGQGTSSPPPGVVARVVVLAEDRVEVRVGAEGPSEARVLTAPPGEAHVFALIVVEDVRARLVDLRLWIAPSPPSPPLVTQPEPQPEPPPLPAPSSAPSTPRRVGAVAPPTRSPVADERSEPVRVWIGGGPAGLLPAGGLGPTVQGLVGLSVEPFERWEIGAVGLLPTIGSFVRAPEGKAEVRATIVAGHAHFIPWRSGGFSIGVGAGGGPLFLAMRADAPAPYVGREVTNVSGVYFLEVTCARTLGDWFRIQALLLAGASGPRPVLAFDDREAAAWGRPFGALAFRGEVGLTPGSGRQDP